MSTATPDADEILIALEKAIPEIRDEHVADAVAWLPHDLVPWEEGRNFAFLGGDDWVPGEAKDTEQVRAALLALALTKDNLPSHHRLLAVYMGPHGVWGPIIGGFTAEDNRHGIVLRDFAVVTRMVDPLDFEARRLSHMTQGYRQESAFEREHTVLDVLALMALHERVCAGFEWQLADAVADARLAKILRLLADDDELTARTFTRFLGVGLTVAPDEAVISVARAANETGILGGDIADFDAQRGLIASARLGGAEGVARAIRETVAVLGLADVEGLGADAAAARDRLLAV